MSTLTCTYISPERIGPPQDSRCFHFPSKTKFSFLLSREKKDEIKEYGALDSFFAFVLPCCRQEHVMTQSLFAPIYTLVPIYWGILKEQFASALHSLQDRCTYLLTDFLLLLFTFYAYSNKWRRKIEKQEKKMPNAVLLFRLKEHYTQLAHIFSQ